MMVIPILTLFSFLSALALAPDAMLCLEETLTVRKQSAKGQKVIDCSYSSPPPFHAFYFHLLLCISSIPCIPFPSPTLHLLHSMHSISISYSSPPPFHAFYFHLLLCISSIPCIPFPSPTLHLLHSMHSISISYSASPPFHAFYFHLLLCISSIPCIPFPSPTLHLLHSMHSISISYSASPPFHAFHFHLLLCISSIPCIPFPSRTLNLFHSMLSGIDCFLMSRNRRDGHRIGSGRIQIPSEKYVEREHHDHRIVQSDREHDRNDRWYDRCGNGTKVMKVFFSFFHMSCSSVSSSLHHFFLTSVTYDFSASSFILLTMRSLLYFSKLPHSWFFHMP